MVNFLNLISNFLVRSFSLSDNKCVAFHVIILQSFKCNKTDYPRQAENAVGVNIVLFTL